MSIETFSLAVLPSLFCSIVMLLIGVRQRKSEKRNEDLTAARKRETLLSMELQMATAKMSYAVAMALKRGHANGEVEEAIEAYETARKKYIDFLNEQATDHLN